MTGDPVQISYGCGVTTSRSLTPDDTDSSNILKRWEVDKYIFRGATSTAANIDAIFTLRKAHAVLFARYEAHRQKAQGLDLSISALTTLQAETFSFLTTTAVSATGNVLGGTVSNLLIAQFTIDLDYETPLNSSGSSFELLKSYQLVLEKRVLNAADAV